jgi:MOSC domain-containing protein YiiM
MKVISLNVGLPREVSWRGQTVSTGIFKQPVESRVMLRALNLDGDRQADLTVHGGLDKAVYAYPAEHYEHWRGELPDMELPWGMFGENLTTQGLAESAINIGDRFRIGSAHVIVTQPRMPCFKLGIKFGRPDIIKRFLHSRRSGWYMAVESEGEIGLSDSIELLSRDENHVTVTDIVRLYVEDKGDLETLQRAVQVRALPEGWRNHFLQQIKELSHRE